MSVAQTGQHVSSSDSTLGRRPARAGLRSGAASAVSHLPAVLIATPDTRIGGTEKNILLYMRALKDRFQFHLLTWHPGGPLPEQARALGAVTYECRSLRELVWIHPWLAFELRACGVRLIHGFLYQGNIAAALLSKWSGLPYLVSERGLDLFRPDWQVALSRWAHHTAVASLCVSHAVARRVRDREHVPAARAPVVPGAVEPERLLAESQNDPVRVDLPAGAFKILAVGHLRAEKGHAVLLNALARLPADLNIHTCIAGAGPLEAELKAQARALGIESRVQWLGALPRAHRIMPRFDLLVVPSDEEGFPNVVLEAQAHSLPVLAGRIGGTLEFIDDGVSGFLFEPRNAESLAAAIERLARNPALRLAVRPAARRVTRRYSLDSAAAQLAAVYTSLIRP